MLLPCATVFQQPVLDQEVPKMGIRDSKSWALRIVWIKAPEHELNSTNSQTPKGALMLQTIASRAASCKYLKISLRRLTTTLV